MSSIQWFISSEKNRLPFVSTTQILGIHRPHPVAVRAALPPLPMKPCLLHRQRHSSVGVEDGPLPYAGDDLPGTVQGPDAPYFQAFFNNRCHGTTLSCRRLLQGAVRSVRQGDGQTCHASRTPSIKAPIHRILKYTSSFRNPAWSAARFRGRLIRVGGVTDAVRNEVVSGFSVVTRHCMASAPLVRAPAADRTRSTLAQPSGTSRNAMKDTSPTRVTKVAPA